MANYILNWLQHVTLQCFHCFQFYDKNVNWNEFAVKAKEKKIPVLIYMYIVWLCFDSKALQLHRIHCIRIGILIPV